MLVHGGPSDERAQYGYGPFLHWLTNRGYGVFYVNYRGSPGFGKAFVNGQRMEWGGKMHEDLLDQVEWAVAEKITTRDQVAILGGSYGGYATLVGMTMTPDVFACGVDLVGPSNLEIFMPHWDEDVMSKVIGDPRTEEGRAFLRSRSPINFAHQMKHPLLIGQGANDSRVPQSQSDSMVEVMKEKNIPVTYVLYPDEGHGLLRRENNASFWAITEGFLASASAAATRRSPTSSKARARRSWPGADLVPGLDAALARAARRRQRRSRERRFARRAAACSHSAARAARREVERPLRARASPRRSARSTTSTSPRRAPGSRRRTRSPTLLRRHAPRRASRLPRPSGRARRRGSFRSSAGRTSIDVEQPDDRDQPAIWCERATEARAASWSTSRQRTRPSSPSWSRFRPAAATSPTVSRAADATAPRSTSGTPQTGATLAETIAATAVPTVAWHPSEQGFFYNVTRRIIGAEIDGQDDGVYWHRLGTPVARGPLRLVELESARAEKVHGLYPFVPDGGDVLFVIATNFVTSARGLAFWPLPEDPAAASAPANAPLID